MADTDIGQKLSKMADYGPKKKKTKRSFLQQAQRARRSAVRDGEQSIAFKGTNIDKDQYDYLIRVLERWRDPFEDDDERSIFVRNVFQQMEGNESDLCGNKLASRVIELLLPFADISVIQQFTDQLNENLRKHCTNQFSSHILEKLMILCCFKSLEGQESKFKPWIIKMCKFLCNNFAEFSGNIYASHLLRTCIQCITGTRVVEPRKNNQTEGYDQYDTFQFTGMDELEECQEILKVKVLQTDQESLKNELTSVVIQYYLRAMKSVKKKEHLKAVIQFLRETIFTPAADFVEDQSLVRLLEAILDASGARLPKMYEKLYTNLFLDKLVVMSTHSQANFLVQRFFDNLPVGGTEIFEKSYTEIAPELEKLIEQGFVGVVLSIVKASVRLKYHQTIILQDLAKAFHCNENLDGLALACIRMLPTEQAAKKDEIKITLNSSLLFQELLDFNKPIKIIRSLLAVDAQTLRKIFSDRSGTHILNRFLTSSSIGEKSRDVLVKQLRGEYADLACSKHGSWAIQKLWGAIGIKNREMIVEELAKKESVLRNHEFGRFVHTSCAITVFKHQRADWNQIITKAEKEKKLFKDIIEGKSNKRKNEDTKESQVEEDIKKEDLKDVIKKDEAIKEESEPPAKKKKKKKEKSYLDDL